MNSNGHAVPKSTGSVLRDDHTRQNGNGLPDQQRHLPTPDPDFPCPAPTRRPPSTHPRTADVHERTALDHQPQRPQWCCIACDQTWPCTAYREHVVYDTTRTQLAILMTIRMTEAAADLPNPTPAGLWHRFIAWTRHRPG